MATSAGSLRLPRALPAHPDAIILSSAILSRTSAIIADPDRLPPTLVIHHRRDRCWATPPEAVEDFKEWGGARVRVIWFRGGRNRGDPCAPHGAHGFSGLDDQVVAAASNFLLNAARR
jgi:hypothetical protein